MEPSFIISMSEQEFKEFLKSAIKEIIGDDLLKLKTNLPDILNIKEAAAFLKIKISTLYEKTSKKIIPHFKKGNKLYFNSSELQEWIKTGKITTKQELESKAVSYLIKKTKTGRKK